MGKSRHMNPTKRIPPFAAALLATACVVAAMGPVGGAGVAAAQEGSREELNPRLERLVRELESRRQSLHVPGMAIAVVHEDEVILTRGFGLADVENETSVTPETLFAIGSTTKAFTAALVGILVDQGKMRWDDPITKYLSYFTLPIDSADADAVVTVEDLLSHRTGFSRMGVLWAAGAVPLEEVLRTATRAEPWAPFRKAFHYNNVTFAAAGVAAGVAAGGDWHVLVDRHLFKPLGMVSSTTSIRQVQDDPRLSRGYVWRQDQDRFQALPLRNLDSIAPAGAINSNALDMAQWLRFQLARGTYKGKRLLSEEAHEKTWTREIAVANGVDYGLGWMLGEWQNQQVVQHGGNIDGFSAQVVLFPDANLGFALLTNTSATPLQALSTHLVADALLSASPDEEGVVGDYTDYLGRYHADFGPFDDTFFRVLTRNDRLAVDVPGQTVYELKPPDEAGKWYFALPQEIAVSFERNDAGAVIAMKMYQAGLTFELPREGVARQAEAEVDIREVQPYLGTYHFKEANVDYTVKVHNGRLAVDVPGQIVYELHPPNDEGKWVFRASDKIAVAFVKSGSGEVDAMKFYQEGRQWELPHTKTLESQELPTLEAILARRSLSPWHELESLRLRGKIRMAQAGVEGHLTLAALGTERLRSEMDLGRFGWIRTVIAARSGHRDSNILPFQELSGKFLTQARLEHPAALWGDWRRFFDSIQVVGGESLDEKKVHVLLLTAGDLPALRLYVDAATGDPVKAEQQTLDPTLGQSVRTVTRFEDYREVSGLRLPFRSISSNEWNGRVVLQLEKVEPNVDLDESAFAVEATQGNG